MALLNSDGLYVRFGSDQGKRSSHAGVTHSDNKTSELCVDVTLTGAARTIYPSDRNGDGINDGFIVGLDTPLPKNCLIAAVRVLNEVTPAGGTNYTVGTYQVDGTVDTANGLLTTAGAAGAQVGTQLTADRYVGVVTTGTYTAGQIKIVITYYMA